MSGKWESLGNQLPMRGWQLLDIHTKYSNPEDCLKALIGKWLQEEHLNTWSHLVHALKNPNVGESDRGEHLKENTFQVNYSAQIIVQTQL